MNDDAHHREVPTVGRKKTKPRRDAEALLSPQAPRHSKRWLPEVPSL